MKTYQAATISVFLMAAACLLFTGGMAIGARDAKLFQAQDKHRITMLARSCGKAGTLIQDPTTNDFSCIYRNADGQTVMRYVTDAPTLVVRN